MATTEKTARQLLNEFRMEMSKDPSPEVIAQANAAIERQLCSEQARRDSYRRRTAQRRDNR